MGCGRGEGGVDDDYLAFDVLHVGDDWETPV